MTMKPVAQANPPNQYYFIARQGPSWIFRPQYGDLSTTFFLQVSTALFVDYFSSLAPLGSGLMGRTIYL